MNLSLGPSTSTRGRRHERLGVAVLAVLAVLAMASPASAQTAGNPVESNSSAATGSASAVPSDGGAGAKGAKTYCFMRNAGNTHKVSWDAAYALIKRQSASLFKTSPEHASVLITEAVVNNPSAYPDCGKYLGDLYVK